MTAYVQDRFHALDAARAFALLLGIVLHATMSFFLPIPAQDGSQSGALAITFYVIHTFRMSLFFLIAGFFAHMLFHRRGARAFVKDRAKRIVVPMTVGWVLLAPVTVAILIAGFTRTFPDGASVGMGVDDAAMAPRGFPLTHLWFLYYLCIFYVLVLVLRAGFVAWVDRSGGVRARIDAAVRVLLSSCLAPLALAAPLFAVLHFDPAWPVWFGIPAPDTGFAPRLSALVGFGTAFGFGWCMHRQTDLLDVLRRRWAVHLVLALGLTVSCLALVGATPPAQMYVIPGPTWHRFAYALGYTVSIWCWVFGLVGAALGFCPGASPVRRYLADASYWCYLVHLPIVFGLQVLVADWPLHWSVKFPLIVVVTLALSFASYHWLVRSTFVGEVLNGRRHPRGRGVVRQARHERDRAATVRAAPVEGLAPIPQDIHQTPVAALAGVTKRYGKTVALDDVSFAVRPGELLAMLGPNGAGKTTAIGLWLGTLEADAGTVHLMGGSPFEVQSRLGVGVMLQDVSLAPMLSAREHIALAASCYRDPLSVEEVVALTGIAAFADKRYAALSGGQKRQVQFAVAICGRPTLLFLDEPTVGLDVSAREAMWRTIRALLDGGRSIVLTTHYLEEAEALASRVAVLAKGRVIADGSVEAMRALVACRRIRCACAIEVDEIRRWPGVVEAVREQHLVQVTASDAEAVLQRLFAADPHLRHLEVRQASLADALTELTRDAA